MAEAGFPIALYETVTDLNQYLKDHGLGFDYAGLVVKVASPDVKGILQSLTGAGAIPEYAYRKGLSCIRSCGTPIAVISANTISPLSSFRPRRRPPSRSVKTRPSCSMARP